MRRAQRVGGPAALLAVVGEGAVVDPSHAVGVARARTPRGRSRRRGTPSGRSTPHLVQRTRSSVEAESLRAARRAVAGAVDPPRQRGRRRRVGRRRRAVSSTSSCDGEPRRAASASSDDLEHASLVGGRDLGERRAAATVGDRDGDEAVAAARPRRSSQRWSLSGRDRRRRCEPFDELDQVVGVATRWAGARCRPVASSGQYPRLGAAWSTRRSRQVRRTARSRNPAAMLAAARVSIVQNEANQVPATWIGAVEIRRSAAHGFDGPPHGGSSPFSASAFASACTVAIAQRSSGLDRAPQRAASDQAVAARPRGSR